MAPKYSITPLLVLFSLFSVLVYADSLPLPLPPDSPEYSNRTADGYGGYCNKTVIDPNLDCSSKYGGDYYGIGVRLGIYFTWLTSWIANVFLPEEIAGALDANTMFLLSVMASIFYSTSKGILSYIDGLILMHLSSGYLFGCLSFWGYRTRHYQNEGPMGIRHFGRFGTHCRLVLAVAISGYGVWFWTKGVKDGLQIPVSPATDNVIPCQCYPLKTFFFAKLRVYGGIRYFFILMSTSCTVYYSSMLLVAAVERTHHLVHILNKTKPVFESVIYETGLSTKELDFLYNFLRIGNLLWMIFAAVEVEMTIIWNKAKAVIAAGDQVAYPAQILPMLIGAFGLLRILFLLFWSIYEPEDREQGETATAPPEDAQGNLSAGNEMRAANQGLGIQAKEMTVSPTPYPQGPGTTIMGHGQDHNPVHIRRSLFHRYMVAWLPWLSQFPFWTKPSGGYQHTRVRSRDWPRPRNSRNPKSSSARHSEMVFLRRSPQTPNDRFESPAPGDMASPQLTSPVSPMIKFDERV